MSSQSNGDTPRFTLVLSPEAQGHIARLPYGWPITLRAAWEKLERDPYPGRGKIEIRRPPARLELIEGERLFHYVFGNVAIYYSVLEDLDIVYVHRVTPLFL